MRYLVTGGAGFIGSHLVDALLEADHQVVVLDDLSTGDLDNLRAVRESVEFHNGSVLDEGVLAQASDGVDGIFHLAALVSVPQSVEQPLVCHEQNATATLKVLEAARAAGAGVVFPGSASAYGRAEGQTREADTPDPLSPYAASKLCGEAYCRTYARLHRLPVAVLRFFNVFGPRQPANSPYSGVVAAFCQALVSGRVPRIHGDGSQERDFVYVGDVARACRAAMDRLVPESRLPDCPILNIATGQSRSVVELLEKLQAEAGTQLQPEYTPARVGDIKRSVADVTSAGELLDFRPQVSFSQGLQETYNWYRSISK